MHVVTGSLVPPNKIRRDNPVTHVVVCLRGNRQLPIIFLKWININVIKMRNCVK